MINVPIAQSVRFRDLTAGLFNFDNTFFDCGRFTQYVAEGNFMIQVVVPNDGTILKLRLIHTSTSVTLSNTALIVRIGSYIYHTFTINLATYAGEVCYFIAEYKPDELSDEIKAFRSEYFTVQDQPTFLKLNWFNSVYAFMLDYTILVNELWIDGDFSEFTNVGDMSVYSNQGEDVILKSIVSRKFTLKCDVPNYIAEQLVLAMSHNNFYINDIQFVAVKKPTLKQLGRSKMYNVTAELKQKTIVGINTHFVA